MAVSMNLCLAASVCLISRIKSNQTAFSLLVISIAFFFYWPILRNEIYLLCPNAAILLLILLSPLTLYLLCEFSTVLAIGYLFFHFSILIICPWILIKMQPLKRLFLLLLFIKIFISKEIQKILSLYCSSTTNFIY